jgi:hypothetical protein
VLWEWVHGLGQEIARERLGKAWSKAGNDAKLTGTQIGEKDEVARALEQHRTGPERAPHERVLKKLVGTPGFEPGTP